MTEADIVKIDYNEKNNFKSLYLSVVVKTGLHQVNAGAGLREV